jgi:hypothetical protein
VRAGTASGRCRVRRCFGFLPNYKTHLRHRKVFRLPQDTPEISVCFLLASNQQEHCPVQQMLGNQRTGVQAHRMLCPLRTSMPPCAPKCHGTGTGPRHCESPVASMPTVDSRPDLR